MGGVDFGWRAARGPKQLLTKNLEILKKNEAHQDHEQ